jgi:hypothetical protein
MPYIRPLLETGFAKHHTSFVRTKVKSVWASEIARITAETCDATVAVVRRPETAAFVVEVNSAEGCAGQRSLPAP